MTDALDTKQFQAQLQRLDALVREVERFADPAARSHAREIVGALLDLHGAGLGRIFSRLADAGEVGRAVINDCANDDVVGGLLLLHGLHPFDLETRVRQALDDIRPYLRSHGGNVELVSIRDGAVRLRLQGSCHGCPSSAQTMRQTIEEAIIGRAPDAASVEVEGVVETPVASDAERDGARVALPLV